MFVIDGIGTATPQHSITQEDAADILQGLFQQNSGAGGTSTRAREQTIYEKAGVSTRYSVLLHSSTNGESARQDFYSPARSAVDFGPSTETRMRRYEVEAGPLVVQAARAALQDADCDPRQITHLITASCSGFTAPGVDLTIIQELGLPLDTLRTHIGFMGCHAVINALRVAQAFAASNPQACVLICAVELCSLHHQYGERIDQIIANALFADGAAALVGRDHGSHRPHRWAVRATGSTLIPDTADYLSWHIRDHGFEMRLSPRLPVTIQQKLRPWFESWLASNNLTLSEIGSWAIHPGGPRVLQACGTALGLGAESLLASEQVLARYGNMSSPTVVFILEQLRKSGARPPCVMLAFGPGLAVEAALLVEAV